VWEKEREREREREREKKKERMYCRELTDFVKVENDVKFTDIAKIFVKQKTKLMYHIKHNQFIVVPINRNNEKYTSISFTTTNTNNVRLKQEIKL
jgi:hypothetical protein